MANISFAYDFSATTNGQVLYYYLYHGSVTVTFPNQGHPENPWSGFTKPSGDVIIPDSVTYNNTTYAVKAIGFVVFKGCSDILSVTIPETIDTIFADAFRDCTSLANVYLASSIPPSLCQYDGTDEGYTIGVNWPFINNATNRMFHIPCGSMESYNTNMYWSSHSNYLQEPEGPEFAVWITSNDSIMDLSPLSPIRPYYDIDIRCDSSATIHVYVPNYGFRFSHWEDGSRSNPRTIFLLHDTILGAVFERDSVWVDAVSEDSLLGTVLGGGWYAIYDTASFTAIPSEHHHLTYWTVSMEHSFISYDSPIYHNPLELYIEGQTTLTAHFAIDTLSVNVASSDIARGRVEGGGLFEYGTPCTISAEAYSGYHFDHWSNGATYNPYTFAVLENTELTAVFLAEGEVGIGDIIANDINVYSNEGRIVVEGTKDEIRIFDMFGRSVCNEALPAGVYMVKIGEQPARKVVVMQ